MIPFPMNGMIKTPIPSIGLTPYNNMQNIVSICHRFVDEFDTTYDNLLLLAIPVLERLFNQLYCKGTARFFAQCHLPDCRGIVPML